MDAIRTWKSWYLVPKATTLPIVPLPDQLKPEY